MPRRTPDQGVKPFEFRTGVGGLPPLGGIFRAGDPATIPPNKHHLVVNARITPGGLYSRPGMARVFDTTVSECITGITSFPQAGGGLLLYPGCTVGAFNNPVSMRMIFPGRSTSYSEYVFFTNEELSEQGSVAAPIVTSGWFIYEAQVHWWQVASSIYSCWRAAMPELSGVQGDDTYRHQQCYNSDGTINGSGAQNPCPTGTAWPHGHPYSPGEKVFSMPAAVTGIVALLPIPQRGDEPLSGDLVVQESLYIVATVTGGTGLALYRWDGLSVTLETVTLTIPAGAEETAVAMTALGPGTLCIFIGGDDTTGGVAYLKDADGTWSTKTGLRITATPKRFYPRFGFSWNGVPYFLGLGTMRSSVRRAQLIKWNGTDFQLVIDFSTDAVLASGVTAVTHFGQIGPDIYFLTYGSQDYVDLPTALIRYDIPSGTYSGSPVYLNTIANPAGIFWLTAGSTSCYVGGEFYNDPILAQPEAEACHAVYDWTALGSPTLVYRVYESDFPESNGSPISLAALPFVPSSGTTGERNGNTLIGGR